jgi:hypothetical protein
LPRPDVSYLTYMSIIDQIKERIAEGHLVEIDWRDLRSPDQNRYRRWIYVSSAIHREMNQRSAQQAFRVLSAQFQSFLSGANIPVALEANHKHAEWARLQKPGDEVWESRIRYTSPELRILGRFAARDVFVALNLYDYQLRGKKAWDRAKLLCQSDWSLLFPTMSPVQGRTIHDYLRAKFTLI